MTIDRKNDPDWMKRSRKDAFDKASDRGLLELKERERAREARIRELSAEAQKRIAMGREQREKEVAARREQQDKLRERNKAAIGMEFLDPQNKEGGRKRPTEKHHTPHPPGVRAKGPTVRTWSGEQMEKLVEAELEKRYAEAIDGIRKGWEATELEMIDWYERSAQTSPQERFLRNAREITQEKGGRER